VISLEYSSRCDEWRGGGGLSAWERDGVAFQRIRTAKGFPYTLLSAPHPHCAPSACSLPPAITSLPIYVGWETLLSPHRSGPGSISFGPGSAKFSDATRPAAMQSVCSRVRGTGATAIFATHYHYAIAKNKSARGIRRRYVGSADTCVNLSRINKIVKRSSET
jgi:hypothetical protein